MLVLRLIGALILIVPPLANKLIFTGLIPILVILALIVINEDPLPEVISKVTVGKDWPCVVEISEPPGVTVFIGEYWAYVAPLNTRGADRVIVLLACIPTLYPWLTRVLICDAMVLSMFTSTGSIKKYPLPFAEIAWTVNWPNWRVFPEASIKLSSLRSKGLGWEGWDAIAVIKLWCVIKVFCESNNGGPWVEPVPILFSNK